MADEVPLVSAITTTWNGERYLRETIDSALMQDYPALEVIVVDDGSTDATEAICRSYGDRIRYFRQPKDDKHGVTAYIRAVDEARGKYIAPLDHDDRWLQGKIARQVEAMEAQPDAGVAFTRFRIIDDRGVDQGISKLVGESGDVFHLLLGGNRFCHASAMYRADAVATAGGISLDTGMGDWDLWLRIARTYPVIMLEEALTEYRVHPGGYSARLPRMAEATRRVLANQASRLHPDCPECAAGMARGMRVVAETYLQHFHVEARRGHLAPAFGSLVRAFRASPAGVLAPRHLAPTAKSMATAAIQLVRRRPRRHGA